MEELTRVSPEDDPYLALRTALAVLMMLVLAEPFGISQPMLPVLFIMSIMSNQRGAVNARTFAGPIAMPIFGFVFSWLAAVTVNEPMVFTLVNCLLAMAGLALMMFSGSRAGMLLTIFPVIMGLSAIFSDYALAVMRDSLAMGGVVMFIATAVLNLIFPPLTSAVHVEMVTPLRSTQPLRHLFIRSVIYIPAMIWLFSTGDMNMLTFVIMMVFICGQPRRGLQRNQVIDRIGGTVVGALCTIAVLGLYHLIPEVWILFLLCTLLTYYLIDKMTTGKARPLIYQYTCSTALVMILQSTQGARDAMEVVLQRVVLNSGAMILAIVLIAVLEAILLDPDEELPSHPVPAY